MSFIFFWGGGAKIKHNNKDSFCGLYFSVHFFFHLKVLRLLTILQSGDVTWHFTWFFIKVSRHAFARTWFFQVLCNTYDWPSTINVYETQCYLRSQSFCRIFYKRRPRCSNNLCFAYLEKKSTSKYLLVLLPDKEILKNRFNKIYIYINLFFIFFNSTN